MMKEVGSSGGNYRSLLMSATTQVFHAVIIILAKHFSRIYSSNIKEDTEIAFWRGGQVTEEGLKWLIENGFKTIVDLRAENVKDTFYQASLENAISVGKITLVKIPIEVRMAPLAHQVELFASTVSDSSKRPIYVHSKEGVWRTSAMEAVYDTSNDERNSKSQIDEKFLNLCLD